MRDGRNYIFVSLTNFECKFLILIFSKPNDEKEQDRLDMLHHIYLLIQGGRLNTAPLSNPQRVLDLGTGTGIWALGFAELASHTLTQELKAADRLQRIPRIRRLRYILPQL
jgi:ubiquinone/menaquinone biosynthesis C-methylase UbiE